MQNRVGKTTEHTLVSPSLMVESKNVKNTNACIHNSVFNLILGHCRTCWCHMMVHIKAQSQVKKIIYYVICVDYTLMKTYLLNVMFNFC